MSERVGIIGLGVMGGAMSRNLLRSGHTVAGYDIDAARRSAATEAGVLVGRDTAAVADASDILILSLPSAGALEQVASEISGADDPATLCLETGTLPLETKQQARSVLAKAGVELMDVPLSGTGLQAADATLVVFASGSRAGFDRAEPVFDAIARSAHYLGEFGNGLRMKFIANLLVAIHNLATAEAHVLGMAAGMDPALVQRVMEDGVGSSKIFEIRGPMMVANSYPPAARLDIILKDARLIKDFAEASGAPTPLLDAALDVYVESSASGLGDLDAAALCRYLERRAGIER